MGGSLRKGSWGVEIVITFVRGRGLEGRHLDADKDAARGKARTTTGRSEYHIHSTCCLGGKPKPLWGGLPSELEFLAIGWPRGIRGHSWDIIYLGKAAPEKQGEGVKGGSGREEGRRRRKQSRREDH